MFVTNFVVVLFSCKLAFYVFIALSMCSLYIHGPFLISPFIKSILKSLVILAIWLALSIVIYSLIIYMKKFLHFDWLRACQLIPNSAKKIFFACRKTTLVQKVEIECKNLKLNWLTGKSRKRNSQMANQIFCFQIKRTPWIAQFMTLFFADCVIRVRSFCSTISKLFHIYY